jgi:hypothetical protein
VTISIVDFPFIPGGAGGGSPVIGQQGGEVTGVVTDGSTTYTVTFPTAYTTTSILYSITIIGGATWGGYRIDTNVFNLTLTGFQFTVTGGLSPTVPAPVSVAWLAGGS